MEVKRAIVGTLCLLLMLGACGPAATTAPPPPTAVPATRPPTTTPAPPTQAPVPTAVPPTAAPVPTVPLPAGEELFGAGGLVYQPVPGYSAAYDWYRITLRAPGADPALGPLIVLDASPIYCAESVPADLAELWERVVSCAPWQLDVEQMELGERDTAVVDGSTALVADGSGTVSGSAVRLRLAALKPGPQRALVAVALAPAARWDELAGAFDDLLTSIDLLRWESFTNGNDVSDVALYEGYLWTASSGGVVQYALGGGLAPVKHTTANGLPSNDARALVVCPMPEPTLVVGTWGGGLARYDPAGQSWVYLGGAFGEWYSSYVESLACAPQAGLLVVGYSDGGVDIYDPRDVTWRYIGEDAGLPPGVSSLAASAGGEQIWAASYADGVALIDEQGVTLYDSSSAIPDPYVSQMAVDAAGDLWLAAESGLIHRAGDGTWTLYSAEDIPDLTDGEVSGVAVAPDGSIWVVSSYQVAQFDPQSETVVALYREEEGMALRWATSRAFVDADGWLAYGTYTAGSSVLRDSQWQTYMLEDEPLYDNEITALVQDAAGTIWAGTAYGGIYRFAPTRPAGTWENIYGDLPDPSISTLYADPDGGVWIAHGAGVSYSDGQTWLHLADELPEMASYYAYAIAKDNRGRLWLGGDDGARIWDGQEMSTLTEEGGLPASQVLALLPDGDAMWVGTVDGLARVKAGAIDIVGGLPEGPVQALALDPSGALLIAAGPTLVQRDPNGGLYELLTTTSGAPITAIAVPPGFDTWVATAGEGLYHLVFQGEAGDWMHVSALEGPPSNYLVGSSILIDRGGALWAGGYTGGIARYGR